MVVPKKSKGKATTPNRGDKKKTTSSQRKALKAAKAQPSTSAPRRPPKRAKLQPKPEEYAYDLEASTSFKVGKNRSLRDVMKLRGKTRAEADRLEERLRPRTAPSLSSPSLLPTFKIIAGSYEKLLYGLEATFDPSSSASPPAPTLKPIFIFPAHVGCVRSVASSGGNEASSGKWLATGSTADEVIKIWDLRKRKEIGGLLQHQGSITYLTFASPSHLLTCSEDGTICLFRSRDWVLLRIFKGHKGRVNAVAMHPSGKLALSVGRDKTIRMWDFMRGKPAGSTKIYKEAELVQWSPSGKVFAIQTLNSIEIFSTAMTLLHQITHTARIQALQFALVDGRGVLLVAGEDKRVAVYEEKLKPGEATTAATAAGVDGEATPDAKYVIVGELAGHQSRVKGIASLPVTFADRSVTVYTSSISSDGKVHLYDLTAALKLEQSSAQPIAVYDTKGSRLTSVTMAMGDSPFSTPGKGGNEDGSEDDESVVEEEEEESEMGEESGGSEGVEDAEDEQGGQAGDDWSGVVDSESD